MPQNYFRCDTCGVLALFTYRIADVGGLSWPPRCDEPSAEPGDRCPGIYELAPQPGDFAMDVGGVKGAAFKAFSVDVDGTPTTVDSLHTLRRIERESEQRYRNGEGEPLRFRMWNQDTTNKDVNAFGTHGEIGEGTVKRAYDSGAAPAKPAQVTRHGQQKPRVKVARGAGKSPLNG